MSLGANLDAIGKISFPKMISGDCSKVVADLTKPGLSDEAMKTLVKGLTDDQADTLMKVIYISLRDEKNTQVMFKWHALVSEEFGLGTIVRCMSDKEVVAES
eukprot:PhF_6_TR14330/c0_g1_i1/m.22983/K05754/ARPC5; actin related protein 2/3 complex, subunit 5